MEKQLPHRYREDQFRRYEIYINHAVNAHPMAVKCDPKLFNVSQITFTARLRDAIKSYATNNWQSKIDRKKFEKIESTFQVSERQDGTILIGTREAIRSWIQSDRIAEVVVEPNSNVLDIKSPFEFDILCQLSHKRFLIPRIKFTGISETLINQMQQTYDIAIDKNSDGTFTII